MAGSSPWVALDASAGLFERERVVPSGWRWRSVMLQTPGQPALLYSPLLGLDDAGRAALDTAGGVGALLAPNHYHYLAISEHLGAYPGARAFSSEVAAKRLALKAKLAFAPPTELPLPEHVSLLVPPGLTTGEVWLRVTTASGVVWVVSDAFFSLPDPPRGPTGLLLRATGTAPGLRIGRTFTGLAVRDARAYKAWLLAQLERDQPTHVVPSHGVVLHDGDAVGAGRPLLERLRELIEARL